MERQWGTLVGEASQESWPEPNSVAGREKNNEQGGLTVEESKLHSLAWLTHPFLVETLIC